jgi:hypothetical protein
MSLSNVWLDTLADGLVRADQVIGVHTHRTPALSGKASRWLLDVVLPGATGSGQGAGWSIGPVHRTLTQTNDDPRDAPATLTRLLAQLDTTSAAGTITTITEPTPSGNGAGAIVRFRFTPFAASEPGRYYDAEYL